MGVMKLRVQREDGSAEMINLGESVIVMEGRYLNRLISASGCEYFFTHDGYYDGWGAGVQTTEAEASAILNAMEIRRSVADA